MKNWKLEIEISVSPNWVEDGFDLKKSDIKQELHDMVSKMLPHAYDHEIKVSAKYVEVSTDHTCKNCSAAGYFHYSCCGDDITGMDYDNCPSCGEHCSLDEDDAETCEECNGTGIIKVNE